MGILNSELDRLRKRNADLEEALGEFLSAMNMHVGTQHELALCAAEDKARALMSDKCQEEE